MAGLQPMASDDPKIDIEAYKQRHQKIEIFSCASLRKWLALLFSNESDLP
jgi:hypothetical protein